MVLLKLELNWSQMVELTRCMSVVLNSEKFIPTQREEIRKEIDSILNDFMEPLVNFTIIAEIKSIAIAANMPRPFIEGVKFVKKGANIGDVINTWGNDEVPLARYFNYGTSLHWTESKTPGKPLVFSGGGSYGRAIYFQGAKNAGNVVFSMGHYVSGVPKVEAMERGYNVGKKRLAEEASKIIQKELKYVE